MTWRHYSGACLVSDMTWHAVFAWSQTWRDMPNSSKTRPCTEPVHVKLHFRHRGKSAAHVCLQRHHILAISMYTSIPSIKWLQSDWWKLWLLCRQKVQAAELKLYTIAEPCQEYVNRCQVASTGSNPRDVNIQFSKLVIWANVNCRQPGNLSRAVPSPSCAMSTMSSSNWNDLHATQASVSCQQCASPKLQDKSQAYHTADASTLRHECSNSHLATVCWNSTLWCKLPAESAQFNLWPSHPGQMNNSYLLYQLIELLVCFDFEVILVPG